MNFIKKSHRVTSSRKGYALKLLVRILIIVGAAVLLGAFNMMTNPKAPVYGKGRVNEGEVEISKLPPSDQIIWIDARSRKDYEAGHIKGALLINEDCYYVQIGALVQIYNKSLTPIVYCSMEACDSSKNIAILLKKEVGADNILVLHGGWEAVQASNLPIAKGAK